MHRNTKVATCCYCGTRAALVLDAGRHELACQGCGAPLHELKAMPMRSDTPRKRDNGAGGPYYRSSEFEHARRRAKPKNRKPKKKKSKTKWFLEEAFDLIEDIFD